MGAYFSKCDFDSDYKAEFNKFWPTAQPEFSVFGLGLLNQCKNVEKPGASDIDTIMKCSSEFTFGFPVETCRIYMQPKERWNIIEQQAATAYPVLHERAVWLYLRFLEHKLLHGSNFEKEIYANMGLVEFVQRLLIKRFAINQLHHNTYITVKGEGAECCFEVPITPTSSNFLDDRLSDDEAKVSAFLSISSHTEFLNDCDPKTPECFNFGTVELDKDRIEISGVIIGIVPPFLSKRNQLEYEDVVVNRKQNTLKNGYGEKQPIFSNAESSKKFDYHKIWKDFYDETGVLYRSVGKVGKRFGASEREGDFFDYLILKKRYTISFDTLLLDAEARASRCGKRGYLYIGPIGLEYWEPENQIKIFLETFSQRLKHLLPKLNHISFVQFVSCFSEHDDITNGSCFESDSHPDSGIKIFISDRKPAEKLRGPEFDNVLLIVAYEMDGNALPGNYFWAGGFPPLSAALVTYGSLMAELQNPHINKTMVFGSNLHVASPDFGVIHIAEYAKRKLGMN